MQNLIGPILIISLVLVSAVSIAYFYFSTDIFTDILKKPLKMISAGMFTIDLGVVLVAIIAYESGQGVDMGNFIGIPVSMYFYALFFIGSFMVIFGSRKFANRPA